MQLNNLRFGKINSVFLGWFVLWFISSSWAL